MEVFSGKCRVTSTEEVEISGAEKRYMLMVESLSNLKVSAPADCAFVLPSRETNFEIGR
jgi:hypothetical protein